MPLSPDFKYLWSTEKNEEDLQWVLYVILGGLLFVLIIIGIILEKLLKYSKLKEERDSLLEAQRSLLTGGSSTEKEKFEISQNGNGM